MLHMRHMTLLAGCAIVALAANTDSGSKPVQGFKGLGKTSDVKPGEPLTGTPTPDVDGNTEGTDSAGTSDTEKAQSSEAPLAETPDVSAHNQAVEEKNRLEAQQIAEEAARQTTAPIGHSLDTEVIPPRVGVEGTLSGAGVDTVTFHGEAAESALQNQEAAVNEQGLTDDGSVLYSSHPIMRLSLGEDWQFDNAQLRVEADRVAEFDKLVSKQPPQIRNAIQKIDIGAANQLIGQLRTSRMKSGIDTSANSFGFNPKQQA